MALNLTKIREVKEEIQSKQSDGKVIYLSKIGKENQPEVLYFVILDHTSKLDGNFAQMKLGWNFERTQLISPASFGQPCEGMDYWEEVRANRSNPLIKAILDDYMSFNGNESWVFPAIVLDYANGKFVSKGLKFLEATPKQYTQLCSLVLDELREVDDWKQFVIKLDSSPKPGAQKGRDYNFQYTPKKYTVTEEELTELAEIDIPKYLSEKLNTSEDCLAALKWKFEGEDKPAILTGGVEEKPVQKPKSSFAEKFNKK